MKKLLFIAIIFAVAFVGCTPQERGVTKNVHTKDEVESRIIGIEETIYEGSSYQIIEVDGHQYISRYSGGIVHLESCPCKKY